MKGKVYFVEAPGRIKIGYTVNPDDRLEKLRQADMETLTVVAVIDGTRRLERHLHGKLAPFRIKGEWFLDCLGVRDAIGECLSSKDAFREEREFTGPTSALDENSFVEESTRLCSRLLTLEKRRGATANEALSLVAIKTGLSYGRVWSLQYRRPKNVTAGELHALRLHGNSAALRAAQALVDQEDGEE